MRALVLVIAVAACTPAHAPAPAAARIDVSDPLALLPANSDLVLTLDIAALRRSPLWATYEKDALTLAAPGFADCAYDPLSEVSTITAGIPSADNAEGIFVVRGVDRDKTLACLHASKAQTNTTAAFDGEFVTLTNKSGNVNIITFTDAKTMVMQGSSHPTKESLAAALKSGAPLRQDAAFLPAAAKLPKTFALAMVMRPGPSKFADTLRAKMGADATGFWFAVDVTDHLELHATVDLANADDAAAIVEAAKPQLEQTKAYVQRFDVTAKGKSLVVELAITEEQLKMFAGIVKSQMGKQ